jgi:hypothetical protein
LHITQTSYLFNSDDNLPEEGRGGLMADLEKRPRGRPRIGESPTKGIRIPVELEAKITAWIDRQPYPKPLPLRSDPTAIERGLLD